MQIDIRDVDEDDHVIKVIVFGEDEHLEVCDDETVFNVKSGNKVTGIYLDSIPDMIKALEKAQELWGD